MITETEDEEVKLEINENVAKCKTCCTSGKCVFQDMKMTRYCDYGKD